MNIALRKVRHNKGFTSMFAGATIGFAIEDTVDATGATISWQTEGMAWMGEISFIFVGDVGEGDDDGSGEDGGGDSGGDSGPGLIDPDIIDPIPVPGTDRPPVRPPRGEDSDHD